MTRDEINHLVAHAAGGVDVVTTERVLDGLERVILSELSRGGGKFTRILALYQSWKK